MAKVERSGPVQVAGIAAVDVHVLPLVVALMPNASLFRLMSVSVTLSETIDVKNLNVKRVYQGFKLKLLTLNSIRDTLKCFFLQIEAYLSIYCVNRT